MRKISKIKVGILSILIVILIGIVTSYINFRNLSIYSQATNGDITSKDGVVYQFNGELTSSYSGGDLKTGGIIGRFEGKSFFTTFFSGPKIIKLKDYAEKDAFLVRGIMLQEVYTKVNQ